MSIGPFGQPSGAPSPEGSTSLSTPVQQPSATNTSSTGATNAQGVPVEFEQMVVTKLQQMEGTRGYLIDTGSLTAIADKLWQSVQLQQLWAGYKSLPTLYAPNLEAQIQATVLNPTQDPTVDPTIITDYTQAVQGAGLSLTPAMLTSLSNATMAANAAVPRPFDTSMVSGYDWGQPLPEDLAASTGWVTHQGVDYGTPAGSRIVTPFAGTVSVKHDPWRGNQVIVTLDNGWQLSFGHVASAELQDGARVNPGDLIAISGQNVGISKGAVTLVELFDPQGRPQNPHTWLDPIFQGTTFRDMGLPGLAGTGMPSVNTILDREYPTVKSDWTALFGSPPSPSDVYNVTQHGSSPTEWKDYMRSLPGHIDGMTVGQISDLRGLVDSVSMTAVGHAGTDGIVKELFDQGMTGQKQVQLWYNEHSPNELDSSTYNQIYSAVQPWMGNVLNDNGADPRVIKQIHDSQPGHPGPQEG